VHRHRLVDREEELVIGRAILALGAMLLPAAGQALTPVEAAPLYRGPAAGSENWSEPRVVIECDGRRDVFNTSEPRYELFLPDPAKASGAALLDLPGGGLRVLGMGDAADAQVQAMLDRGIAVMRLEYRTRQVPVSGIDRECAPPGTDAAPIRFPKLKIANGNANPAPDNRAGQEVLRLAIADAQAALALLHARADELGIDPDRIGVIGTSAGGGVAFGTMLDGGAPAEMKPDFLVSIFGPSLQDVFVPDPAPPLYLVTEADHGPVTDGLLAVFSIWKDAGEKAELHVYEVPNFSMTAALWSPRLFAWMEERRILPSSVEGTRP
jgi:dienelactone hydrolase